MKATPDVVRTVVRSRLASRDGRSRGTLVRATWLTPYDAQLIAEDGERRGRRTSLDVEVSAGTDEVAVAGVRRLLARLIRRGLRVSVRVRRGRSSRRRGAARPGEPARLADE
jgi:hypothetical protein